MLTVHEPADAQTRYDEPLAPAWDVGRPQRALYELEIAGRIGHEVLDVGCGHGEHALWLAQRGHAAMGVDPSSHAIARARRRAEREGLVVPFAVEELLGLGRLGRSFDTAIDAGSFHRVAPGERLAYASALSSVVRRGGRLWLLCFSEHETGHGGPARVTQAELREGFAANGAWTIDSLTESVIESRLFPGGAAAWLLGAIRS